MCSIDDCKSRIVDLTTEIQRLKCEIQQRQYHTELNQIVKDLRNELEDYNMARMNEFRDVNELKKEIDDLHADNQLLQTSIEQLYIEKQKREERIDQLESTPEYLTYRLIELREELSDSSVHQQALILIDEICEFEQIITDEIQNLQQNNFNLLTQISQFLPQDNYIKLKQHLRQLETIHQNLLDELSKLNTQYQQMQDDITKFNNLDNIKRQADRRKQQLQIEKSTISQRKHITQIELETLQTQFNTLQNQLQSNETHRELMSLEQKLSTLLLSPSDDSAYEHIKTRVLQLVSHHNQWLIARLN